MEYKTTDLGLVAAFACFEVYPQDIEKKGNRCVFKFQYEDKKDLDDFIDGYWNNKIQVPPRKYFDNLKMLKSRIHTI